MHDIALTLCGLDNTPWHSSQGTDFIHVVVEATATRKTDGHHQADVPAQSPEELEEEARREEEVQLIWVTGAHAGITSCSPRAHLQSNALCFCGHQSCQGRKLDVK